MQARSAFGNHSRQPVRVKKQSYLKGATIISVGGFISKLLGAAYRIPLVAFLGGKGMGLYQLVYPLYCVLLTVSASGIPTGIARLVSSGSDNRGAERTAFRLYGALGAIGSVLMFAFAVPLAKAQGEEGVALCCRVLSPSVFFVSVISVVRGYFQGKGDMYPTAFTEVGEQVIKVAAGVALASFFREDIIKATAAAVAAVTISEAAVCLYSIVLYMGEKGKVKPLFKEKSPSYKSVLAYTIPLAVTALAFPVSQLFESMAVVNALRRVNADATALYGIFSGCAVTVVNLPVSVAYGLAAASVPQISPLAAKGDLIGAKSKAKNAIVCTLALSIPCAVLLYALAPLAAKIIFPSLSPSEKELLVSLVRIMSVNAVTSSLVQTSSACVTSLGKPLFGAASQWFCALLRVALSAILCAFTPLSIVGAAVSANICYFVAVVLNLCYIISMNNKGGRKNVDNVDRIGNKGRRFNPVG